MFLKLLPNKNLVLTVYGVDKISHQAKSKIVKFTRYTQKERPKLQKAQKKNY